MVTLMEFVLESTITLNKYYYANLAPYICMYAPWLSFVNLRWTLLLYCGWVLLSGLVTRLVTLLLVVIKLLNI